MTALRPFFRYYGGKWRTAPGYPAPRHQLLVEPFAGAAGYSLRHHDRSVVLVEKDLVIASIWQWLLRATAADVLALPDVDERGTDVLDVDPGALALIGMWLCNGVSSPRKTPSAWMRRYPEKLWWGPRARQRIADQLPAIRHWTVICGDWSEGPRGPATRFVDPPYAEQGRHYRHSTVDYAALARACTTWTGQTIVCEQAGATWLPFRPLHCAKATRGVSRESIYTHESGCPPDPRRAMVSPWSWP